MADQAAGAQLGPGSGHQPPGAECRHEPPDAAAGAPPAQPQEPTVPTPQQVPSRAALQVPSPLPAPPEAVRGIGAAGGSDPPSLEWAVAAAEHHSQEQQRQQQQWQQGRQQHEDDAGVGESQGEWMPASPQASPGLPGCAHSALFGWTAVNTLHIAAAPGRCSVARCSFVDNSARAFRRMQTPLSSPHPLLADKR